MDKDLGKVAPYGIYDLDNSVGWVGVGISHDTAEFAVATIAKWWRRLGRRRYPKARSLLITPMAGEAMEPVCDFGSGSSRSSPTEPD